MVDVVDLAAAVLQPVQDAHDGQDVLATQRALRVRNALELEAHVHLHAADRRQVVAVDVEQQALEQGFRLLQRRRLAGTHHAIDIEQGLFAVRVLVGRQRVADVRPDIDMVDRERRQQVDVVLVEEFEHRLGDLLAGLDVDLAGLLVDDVERGVAADQLFRRNADLLEARLLELVQQARRHLGAGLGHRLAGLAVHQIVRQLHAAHRFGLERRVPAVLVALVDDLAVERRQDLLRRQALGLSRIEGLILGNRGRALLPGGVVVERQQQRRHRDLAAAVDADVDQVLGVELEVEPGAAIGDDAGREQVLARAVGLALVVIEEDARRTMHLRDDHALGAVHDEGAVVGHERHVAHVDVLLLDIADRARAGFLVDVPHHELERDLERGGVGDAALLTLLDVVLGLLELVLHELKAGALGEVLDREHAAEDFLQARLGALGRRRDTLEKALVGALLDLDEVRHRGHRLDVAEETTNPFARIEGRGHPASSKVQGR